MWSLVTGGFQKCGEKKENIDEIEALAEVFEADMAEALMKTFMI